MKWIAVIGLIFGVSGGYLWYWMVENLDHFVADFFLPFTAIALVISLMLISNFAFKFLSGISLDLKKSFLTNLLVFVFMIITSYLIYMMEFSSSNLAFSDMRHQIPQETNIYRTYLGPAIILVIIGLLFSSFVALFFDKTIKTKVKEMIAPQTKS